jgi:hypothetical protein
MVKTVDLEYSSIGSAFMVLMIIVICFGFIYLMCSVFNKGMDDIMPESVKHVYNHFLMPDVDYIIEKSSDYLDDSVDYIDGETDRSPGSSDKGPVELVDGSIEQVKEEPDIRLSHQINETRRSDCFTKRK